MELQKQKLFKEELLRRLETGSENVVGFLLENYYLEHFTKDEFREEVLRRLQTGSDNVVLSLLENNYLKNNYLTHFTKDELLIVHEKNLPKFRSSKLLLPYLHAFSSLGLPIARIHYSRLVNELILTTNFQEIIKILRQYGRYLSEEDCIYLFEKLKLMEAGGSERTNKFRVLSRLMYELQFQYAVNFKISYVIATLLREEEQKIVSNILLDSQYPYVKLDFQADKVRRRIWREELYYEFFEGYVMDLELLCDDFNEEEFYENLKAIRHLKKLRHLNLLVFCEYELDLIENVLLGTNIEKIKLYDFSYDSNYPKVRIIRD